MLCQFRALLEIVDRPIQGPDGLFRRFAHWRAVFSLCLPAYALFLDPLFSRRAHARDIRICLADNGQKFVDLRLIFELKRLFTPAVKHNDQIGQGGKNTFSRKAALTHCNALVNAVYCGKWDIVTAVKEIAVQIKRLLPDPARADFPAAFFVLRKRRSFNAHRTERIRSQHFLSPRS